MLGLLSMPMDVRVNILRPREHLSGQQMQEMSPRAIASSSQSKCAMESWQVRRRRGFQELKAGMKMTLECESEQI